MSMCVVSCAVGGGCLQCPVCSLGKTMSALALLHFVLQGQFSCYSRYLLTSYFCIPVHYDEKDIFSFFGVSSRRSCRSLKNHSTSASFDISGWGIDLDYCDTERLAFEMKRSFCHFWDCTQVLHFGLFCWLWGLLHFF